MGQPASSQWSYARKQMEFLIHCFCSDPCIIHGKISTDVKRHLQHTVCLPGSYMGKKSCHNLKLPNSLPWAKSCVIFQEAPSQINAERPHHSHTVIHNITVVYYVLYIYCVKVFSNRKLCTIHKQRPLLSRSHCTCMCQLVFPHSIFSWLINTAHIP